MGITIFVDKKLTAPKSYFTLTDPKTGEEEQHWLELREAITDAEDSDVKSAMASRASVVEGNVLQVKLDVRGARTVKLDTWIKGWSFTDARGRAVPPDKEHIELLPIWIAEVIMPIVTAHAEAWEASQSAARFTEDAEDFDPLATGRPASDGYATREPDNGPTDE